MKKTLRDYQISGSEQAKDILTKYKIVYLAFQVRTGKTATALNTASMYGAKKVLFQLRKKQSAQLSRTTLISDLRLN